MTIFDRLAQAATDETGITRRLFLGRVGKLSALVTAGVAGLVRVPLGMAAPCRTVGCCQLTFCTDCSPNGCPPNCPPYTWYCWYGTAYMRCVECAACQCSRADVIRPPAPGEKPSVSV